MKKVINIFYTEKVKPEEHGHYSNGFIYELEDGTKVYPQSTDPVGYKIVPPTPLTANEGK